MSHRRRVRALATQRTAMVEAITVDMRVSVAPAGHIELSLGKLDVILVIKVFLVRLGVGQLRLAMLSVGKIDAAVFLVAGERLDPQGLRVYPSEARDIVIPLGNR